MMNQPDVLASDGERDLTIAHLREACADGRLTLDEFSDRMNAVLAARTRGQLSTITVDLPSKALTIRQEREPTHWTVTVMGNITRTGAWRVVERTNAVSVMASCTLDLRNATVQGSEIVVNAYVLMGSLKVIVPPTTPVAVDAPAILANVEVKGAAGEDWSGSPVVRVRGAVLMGSIEIVRS